MYSQWTSVREEWATERERLASALEKWESKVKSVESNLGNTAAKFDAGLATLAILQRQQGAISGYGLIGGDGPKSFQHSGSLVTPPSPRMLSADSDRPPHRPKGTNSNMRGCSRLHEVETIVVEEHDEVTRPYTPSLPDDSSDSEPIRQGFIDSEPGTGDGTAPRQLEIPASSVHRHPSRRKPYGRLGQIRSLSWSLSLPRHTRIDMGTWMRMGTSLHHTDSDLVRSPSLCAISTQLTWMFCTVDDQCRGCCR